MKYNIFLFISCLIIIKINGQEPVSAFVDPFIGTGAIDASSLAGSNFPGATMPFGFVQLSPDTEADPDNPASGYDYSHHTIVGFSHTHLSGTGVADLFDLLLMPSAGDIKWSPGDENKVKSGYRSEFSHKNEFASPGYYRVKLEDYNILAELTATEHVGYHRYTFDGEETPYLMIDLDHSLNKKRPYWQCNIIGAEIRKIDSITIEGYRIITGWARMRKIYFTLKFSKPIIDHQMAWGNKAIQGLSVINGTRGIRAALRFNLHKHDQLTVVAGLSSVSIENARENLQKEIGEHSFEIIKRKSQSAWEKVLSNIIIDATPEIKKIFYTGLYHCYIQPNNMADVNGEYQGTDMVIRKSTSGKYYSTFSLWDTYRATHPLYTLLQPKQNTAFIRTMLSQYESYGYLPIWQLWNDENYCMIGNHSIPVIVDAIMKEIPGIDIEKAYEAVKLSSLRDHPQSPFSLLQEYGYFPEDLHSQSVSIGLEIAYNDWCVASLAKKLGKQIDYEFFTNRWHLIKNIYENKTGFFRAKDKNGKWLEPFDPLQYGGNGGNPFTEGNAWQYLWYVPQDIPWMIELFGGINKFKSKLDTFFTLNGGEDNKNGNASGFIGQYAHGNEPSQHIAFLYNYIDQPRKTQYYVSKIMEKFYTATSVGYAGNDDCGQMSAWYIWNALGFYPVNPANGIYDFGSPKVNKAVINLDNGNKFTILTYNLKPECIYIRSVKLNGKKYTKNYITHADIMRGGLLEFEMEK